MFRRQSNEHTEVVDAFDFENTLEFLHNDKNLKHITDDILAKITQNSDFGYDIRYQDCGRLLWYNSAYNKFIHDLGWTLEDVKDWISINAITTVTSYDEDVRLRLEKGHGLMHILNDFSATNIDMIQMLKDTPVGSPTSQVTINVPVSKKTGKLCAVRMTNYVYHNDVLVITEFILLYDLLKKIPNALLDYYQKGNPPKK